MGHLTAAEADRDFDAVAVGDELLGVLELRVEVTDINTGRHPDLLDLHHVLILPGFLFLLALLEAELSVVHQLAHRRHSLGRDLDQIQALLVGDFQRLCGGHDTELLALRADQPDLLVVDVLIQFMH